MSEEIYKPIIGYANYELSNLGNVRRIITKTTKPVKGFAIGNYRIVRVWKDNKYRDFKLHRLMLSYFGPPMPDYKTLALHRDDNSFNNTMDNLVWGDKVDNGQMAVLNGKLVDHHLKTYLTYEEAQQVKAAHESGESMSKIAKRFGCSRWTVSNIVRNKIQKFL